MAAGVAIYRRALVEIVNNYSLDKWEFAVTKNSLSGGLERRYEIVLREDALFVIKHRH